MHRGLSCCMWAGVCDLRTCCGHQWQVAGLTVHLVPAKVEASRRMSKVVCCVLQRAMVDSARLCTVSLAMQRATLRPAQPCIMAVSSLTASSYSQHIECVAVCCPAVRDDEDWENHPNRFKSPVTQQLWSDAIVEIEVRWPSVLWWQLQECAAPKSLPLQCSFRLPSQMCIKSHFLRFADVTACTCLSPFCSNAACAQMHAGAPAG